MAFRGMNPNTLSPKMILLEFPCGILLKSNFQTLFHFTTQDKVSNELCPIFNFVFSIFITLKIPERQEGFKLPMAFYTWPSPTELPF